MGRRNGILTMQGLRRIGGTPDRMSLTLRIAGTVFLLGSAAWAASAPRAGQTPGSAASLPSVMKQMNAASLKFQDVETDVSVDLYTAVVQQHSMQSGTTAFRRSSGGALEMVMHLNAASDQPAIDILYKNGELDVDYPAQKQETILSAGANRGEYDSMLATGFGATSSDLNAAWTVSFVGMENVGGVATAKLDLVPKDEKVRSNFSHVIIWVDPARDISLKQSMVQPNGDSRTATYSNIRYNGHPPGKMFTLSIAHGTQVTHR
jgi:outer membrane lipoprotein-sorting protein